MFKNVVFLVLIMFSNYGLADSFYVGIYTDHIVNNEQLNEDNNLIGYQKGDYTVAYFNNSYGKDSFAVSGEYFLRSYCYFSSGIKYGLVSGYEKTAIPFVAPWVEYKNVGFVMLGSAINIYVKF